MRADFWNNMNFKMQLTPEEKLAYEFAGHWRDVSYRPDLLNINWMRFAKLLTHNRMASTCRADP